MTKNKLSIYLLKEGVSESEALKYSHNSSIVLTDGKRLYYKPTPAKLVKWLNFFGQGINDTDRKYFKNKSTSAVIFYNVEITDGVYRMFAVSFGYGKNLLKSELLERRFGLMVALNSIKVDEIRSVDTNSMEANPLNNRTQASILSNIGNFNIDVEKDLLKAVTGKAEIEQEGDILQGTLSGADSLAVSTDKLYNSLDSFLKACYNQYISENYRTNFEWVDHIQNIKDNDLTKDLDNSLIENINSDEPEKLWISIPEIINYQEPFFFKLKTEEHYDDLDINILKKEFSSAFILSNAKNRRIICSREDNNIIGIWPVYRCLYTEIEKNNKLYILNDGKWYQVEQEFVNTVNSVYSNAIISNIELPIYESNEVEKNYNERTCRQNPDNCFLMDRKLISYGGSEIEFCDIFTKEKQFIHVKKYNGSAVLSHLFAQGLVSAESFFDKKFRHLVNEKLEGDFKVDEIGDILPGEYEIVYAIAKGGTENGKLPDIPFFSKVSFRIAKNRLEKYGYKVSVIGIEKETENSSENASNVNS